MIFTLKLRMDNAAFDDDGTSGGERPELARILRQVAENVSRQDWGATIDANGNRVGEWRVE